MLYVMNHDHPSLDVSLISIGSYCKSICNIVLAPSIKKKDLVDLLPENNLIFYEMSDSKIVTINNLRVSMNRVLKIYRPDFIVFSSLESLSEAVSLFLSEVARSKVKVIAVMHNLNFWDHKGLLCRNALCRYAKYKPRYGLRELYKKVFTRIDGAILLKHYLARRFYEIFPLPTCVIPFRISTIDITNKLSSKDSSKTRFIMPGNVEKSRRDYYLIFEAFRSINNDFELVLLGKAVDKEIISEGTKVLGKRLVYFENRLSESEFAQYMLKSHFVISNLSYELPYGVFKASGSEFDGPAFGVPVLMPVDSPIIQENNVLIRYDRSNLEYTLRECIKSVINKSYEEKYLKSALLSAESLLPARWSEVFYDFLKRVSGLGS